MLFDYSHFFLLSIVVVTVKTTSGALPLMVPVLPVSPAGMVRDVTSHAHLVFMATAAKIGVRDAGKMNPAIIKQGNVGGVTLDGPDPGVHAHLSKLQQQTAETV